MASVRGRHEARAFIAAYTTILSVVPPPRQQRSRAEHGGGEAMSTRQSRRAKPRHRHGPRKEDENEEDVGTAHALIDSNPEPPATQTGNELTDCATGGRLIRLRPALRRVVHRKQRDDCECNGTYASHGHGGYGTFGAYVLGFKSRSSRDESRICARRSVQVLERRAGGVWVLQTRLSLQTRRQFRPEMKPAGRQPAPPPPPTTGTSNSSQSRGCIRQSGKTPSNCQPLSGAREGGGFRHPPTAAYGSGIGEKTGNTNPTSTTPTPWHARLIHRPPSLSLFPAYGDEKCRHFISAIDTPSRAPSLDSSEPRNNGAASVGERLASARARSGHASTTVCPTSAPRTVTPARHTNTRSGSRKSFDFVWGSPQCTRLESSGAERFMRLLTPRSREPMRVKRDEYGTAPECKSGGNVRSPRKPVYQRHRPARFPNAKIRERPHRESNPVRLGGKRVF
ncbi:hypothetical protein PR048_014855 [Dryococelus australis]|uniref:Uncharacterized protein n=1 Tax=Dryococelus australis TaxID=614101 RepID=A0ABQ9HFC6_9NEOP|nr:hypothetical protein PR048_014855 [Dryococelus australis]